MRVLHFFKTYIPDSFTGIERVIWQIAEGTHPLGVRTDVLSLSRRLDTQPLAVGNHLAHTAKLDVYVASTGLSWSVFGAFRTLAANADLIHYHFPWPMMDLVHFASGIRKPTVITYHSDIVKQRRLLQFYRPLMHRFLGEADAIVATSPNYFESSTTLQKFRDKTSVIPIGLNDRAAPPEDLLERWRQRIGGPFLLFVGALRYYKGLATLIDAARLNGLPLVLAGTGEMDQYVRDAELPNVMAVGGVEEADKEALLTLCTGFVFPSHLRSEAFGVALLEAARAGRPMISCEIGTGTSYVNLAGETGLVVPPGDAAALSAAMLGLWHHEAKSQAMGERARDRYERFFTAELMARCYAELYQRLVPGL